MIKQILTALFLGFSAFCFSQTSSEIKEGTVVGVSVMQNPMDGSANYVNFVQNVQTGIMLESIPTEAKLAIGEYTPLEEVITSNGEKIYGFRGKGGFILFHR